MRHYALLPLVLIALSGAACAPRPADPLPQPAGLAVSVETLPAVESAPAFSTYSNSEFGLRFNYPPGWFGPDEYISGQTLRVAVGSDVVYPYSTSREEQVFTVPDAYYVVVQFTRADDNPFTDETLLSLESLADGDSISDQRGLLTRVRPLELGGYQGFEFITTLSESAQTEPFFARQVILRDGRSSTLTIMASPNNVQISAGEDWRAAYRRVDEAHLPDFRLIVDSVRLE